VFEPAKCELHRRPPFLLPPVGACGHRMGKALLLRRKTVYCGCSLAGVSDSQPCTCTAVVPLTAIRGQGAATAVMWLDCVLCKVYAVVWEELQQKHHHVS
jgi:hypothetical protein